MTQHSGIQRDWTSVTVPPKQTLAEESKTSQGKKKEKKGKRCSVVSGRKLLCEGVNTRMKGGGRRVGVWG